MKIHGVESLAVLVIAGFVLVWLGWVFFNVARGFDKNHKD